MQQDFHMTDIYFPQFVNKFLESNLFNSAPLTYRQILMTIVNHAYTSPAFFNDHGVNIKIYPGQLLTTFEGLADLCNSKNIDESTVVFALKEWSRYGILKYEIPHLKVLISLFNHEEFLQVATSENFKEFDPYDQQGFFVEPWEDYHQEFGRGPDYAPYPSHEDYQECLTYIPSSRLSWLRSQHPNAFILLSLIAEKVFKRFELEKSFPSSPKYLEDGEIPLFEIEQLPLSRQEYIIALKVLKECKIIEILEIRQFGTKTKSATIKLIDFSFWTINSEVSQ